MSIGCERKLIKTVDIELFAEDILDLSGDNIKTAVNEIGNEEVWIKEHFEQSTLDTDNFRDKTYRTSKSRKELRQKIIDELFAFERLVDDNETCLGKGGAKPIGKNPIKGKKCFLHIGLPASGKSKIANLIADKTASYLIDPDLVKRKLPEFNQKGGASLVHAESSEINDSLLSMCMQKGFNIVWPKIGNNFNSIKELAEIFVKNEYSFYLILVELDRKIATQRAYSRFIETKRYVPLSLIYDGYANDPTLTYYRMQQKVPHLLSGYLHLDNDVLKGAYPTVIENKGFSPRWLFNENGSIKTGELIK